MRPTIFKRFCTHNRPSGITKDNGISTGRRHRSESSGVAESHYRGSSFPIKDPIDVLLGAGEYCNIILNGIQKINHGFMGQNAEFGGSIIKEEKRNKKRITVKSNSMMTKNDDQQFSKIMRIARPVTTSRPKQNPLALRKTASVSVTPK